MPGPARRRIDAVRGPRPGQIWVAVPGEGTGLPRERRPSTAPARPWRIQSRRSTASPRPRPGNAPDAERQQQQRNQRDVGAAVRARILGKEKRRSKSSVGTEAIVETGCQGSLGHPDRRQGWRAGRAGGARGPDEQGTLARVRAGAGAEQARAALRRARRSAPAAAESSRRGS